MKFSNSKKYKMRKSKLKQIQRVYNSTIYIGSSFPEFMLIDELRENKYKVISKHCFKGNYYVLCTEDSSKEICVLKLIYFEGFVKAKKLSETNVLKNVEEFRKWIKSINFDKRKERVKYYLRPSGKFEMKSTDYSKNTV